MVNGTHVVSTSHGDVAVFDSGGAQGPVVFLHANSVCKEVFGPQIAALGSLCRAIAIDLPGHGASSNALDPARTYSFGGYADCVGEVLATIGVREAAVVGWSLSGHIGIEMTRQFPGLLGLMAIAAPPFERLEDGTVAGFRADPKLGMSGLEIFSRAEAEEFASLVSDQEFPGADPWVNAVVRTDGRARSNMFAALMDMPARHQRDCAEQCTVPMAMVVGSDDRFVDADYVASINYRRLWSEDVQRFEGCGHAPHVQAAERFNPVLKRFLADIGVIRA